ncbi:hypothetical protein DID88_006707 [Monilinia fructigena]|uniref:Ketoreductase (KR) domain-containing protein n=1 Tax=Monilinia fructigena TaxID=38457 RepID=A0A395IG61_9HELO|nr:hypothetical protein DID88_006707 [Monilinia fructigena]
MVFFIDHLKSHTIVSLPIPKKKFTGQTIIVTGSNSGLGLEAAREFARLDAQKVILALLALGESEKRGQKGRVVANVVNPGLVDTAIMRHATGATKHLMQGIMALMARTTEEGAKTLVIGAEGERKRMESIWMMERWGKYHHGQLPSME